MKIQSLKIRSFRNIGLLEWNPGAFLNLVLGKNGQGKTNLLDAIALLCQGKPMRAIRSNEELIQQGQPASRLEARLAVDTPMDVAMTLDCDGKQVWVDKKSVRDSLKLRERIALIAFVPEDLGAIFGGASTRRKLLDQVCVSLFPNYLRYYRQYEKALLQRNRLLKAPIVDWLELESFTRVLSDYALELEKIRHETLQILGPFYQDSIQVLSGGFLKIELKYEPSSQGKLYDALLARRLEERARKTTILGPHLDDLDIFMNGSPSRFSASRGQARMMILAFKMAQLGCVLANRGTTPILLLDDVVGELDQDNANRLFSTIEKVQAQTFLTTTHADLLPNSWQGEAERVFIQAGQVFDQEPLEGARA
ncbi:MAG: DNA replication and repair protein RecF [Myxococcaceae bacterium]|nr:DNA replication and repair protein RecF [Myxococcaceae bacterium]